MLHANARAPESPDLEAEVRRVEEEERLAEQQRLAEAERNRREREDRNQGDEDVRTPKRTNDLFP